MAPSTLSASSGLPLGYRSPAMDLNNAGGASGNWPRIAWLPITTISRSPAMRPAVRIRCSSSERFIHASALGGREYTGERRGLPQAGGRFAGVGDEGRDPRPRLFEDGAPFPQRARDAVAGTRGPRRDVAPSDGEQPEFGSDLSRDQAMHREAARFDDPVLDQPGGGSRDHRWPPARRNAKARLVLARAVAAHALCGGLCPPRCRAPRAAAGVVHLTIVTPYGNIPHPSSPNCLRLQTAGPTFIH